MASADETLGGRRRERERLLTAVVMAGGLAIGGLVWLFPTLFGDRAEARVVLLAILAGLAAVGFAIVVLRRLRDEERHRLLSEFLAYSPEGRYAQARLLDIQSGEPRWARVEPP